MTVKTIKIFATNRPADYSSKNFAHCPKYFLPDLIRHTLHYICADFKSFNNGILSFNILFKYSNKIMYVIHLVNNLFFFVVLLHNLKY